MAYHHTSTQRSTRLSVVAFSQLDKPMHHFAVFGIATFKRCNPHFWGVEADILYDYRQLVVTSDEESGEIVLKI